jgi:hypothetical protein
MGDAEVKKLNSQRKNITNCSLVLFLSILQFTMHCKSGTGTKSHLTHVVSCFTIILCWLHLRRIWHTICQKNGKAYLTHVKQNMLHMWLIVLHLKQLCHIVCHILLCAGTDLQCASVTAVFFLLLPIVLLLYQIVKLYLQFL